MPDPMHKYILCAGHTPHSDEAGAVRRVCHGVDVRFVSSADIRALKGFITKVCSTHDTPVNTMTVCWTLYLMGALMSISDKQMDALVSDIRHGVYGMITFQFITSKRIIWVSLDPGVLVRKCGLVYADSVMLNDPSTAGVLGIRVEST
jgi:hypothetical protein